MTAPGSEESLEVERKQIDGLRRLANLATPSDPWTACTAPLTTLVVDHDGGFRACRWASRQVHPPGTPTKAWQGEGFRKLREQLGDGKLPCDHCHECTRWIRHGLMELAPMLRDHGHESVGPAPASAQRLVVRLPISDAASAALHDHLNGDQKGIPKIVFEADTVADLRCETLPDVVAAAMRASEDTHLQLLLRDCHMEDGGELTDHVPDCFHEIEVTLDGNDAQTLAAAIQVAERDGASLRARFLFTPDNWFEFEDCANTCSDAGIPLDLRVLDIGGHVPVAALPPEELQFLRDAVEHTWPRFQPDTLPSALTENAFTNLRDELRHMLREQVEEQDAVAVADKGARLRLPPPDASWNTTPSLQEEWWPRLFSRSHLEAVERWLVELLPGNQELLTTTEGAWIRALIQRVATEKHTPELLEWLRANYAPIEARRDLAGQDLHFAENFDLGAYGGPWIDKLQLDAVDERTRPFDIPEANAPGGNPDVTVLVPSYRHELYIEETLQSVLAQTHRQLRVLVADDRSPDATVERARTIADERIEVVVNETNLGLGNSVLAALDHVETPYVALLNSDDLLHPEHLARCIERLDEDPGAQLVTTGISLIDSQGGSLTPDNVSLVLDGKKVFDWVHWFEQVRPKEELAPAELFPELLERNFLVTSSNLVARTDWLRAQAQELRSLKYCLDWQLFLQAALEGSLRHLPAPLIAYRLHATNTVWFREGRRWSYYLEVNRVAAEAIRRFLKVGPGDEGERFHTVIAAVARRLTANGEIDGLALFLNAVLDTVQLDAATAEDVSVQELVEHLNQRAEQLRIAEDSAEVHSEEGSDQRDQLLGELANEQLKTERNQRLWLVGYVAELERQKSELHADQISRIERANQQEERIASLYEDQKARIARTEDLEARVRDTFAQLDTQREQREQLEIRVREANQRTDEIRGRKEAAEATVSELRRELDETERRVRQAKQDADKLRHDRNDVAERLDARKRDLAQANERRASLQQQLDELKTEQGHLKRRLATTVAERDRAKDALEAESAQVAALREAKNQLSGQVHDLRKEIDRLLRTREFRLGNFIWNKLPLGFMASSGKKWYRRLLNAKDRAKMMFGRSKKPEGTAVVAACWQWPIYSHTFVYQEMVSLNQTGLDVQLFHWDLGSTDQLHAAFQYLYDNRTQLQPVWETHKKDKEHFEKTRPGRLRSFLERIAPLCDKSVEELEMAPIVLQGCTFARMAELANARYLHSYFFYDQSFMAMLAAWLLELPRGVSCYADHMMDDYEFKFVPLHIELADVIVATSARIKRELSELSGGKFDDKIVVKPNGVDGKRFPPRSRPVRKPDEPFEVLSVSRIEPKKGLTHLVEAMAELKKRGHTVIAHIIGSKDPHSAGSVEYSEMFEKCIAEHGLQDQVILHGMMKQEQMPPIIEKCRAFVAPYVETESGDKDGIPTAMLEALASSLPILTTNSGSITEVVDDGVEGLVVAQRDSMAYAAALEKVITDPQLEQQMAKAARARFDRDFDIQVTEKRLHERIHGFLNAKV